ncbi:GNAT family N-acetyltransferase [Microbacterium sp. 179-I 3D3 NHS]|uniref:GNAT family N-acetyltransferase n=1 Tax=unclassified Microbacterium TaxID=2609290 RepID=UPI0039A23821
MSGTWLPSDFLHPRLVEWRDGVHLRPIRASDVDIDMPAVMGSREMLWEMYGEAWGWPPATMTPEQDADDLQRHADEVERHESFNYAILAADESELYGCVYIDPVDADGIEAEVSWWVTAEAPEWLNRELGRRVTAWIDSAWPFTRVHTPFNRTRFPA